MFVMRRAVSLLHFRAGLPSAQYAEALSQECCYATSALGDAHQQETITLTAMPRESSGRLAAKKLRKQGKTPAVLFSLPKNETLLLSFPAKDISDLVNKLRRTGFACQIFNVEVDQGNEDEKQVYRALGRQVHMNAATDVIENITLLHCPPEREVHVDIPLKVIGEDVSPGVKAGGYINVIERTLPCTCFGARIPLEFELDIGALNIGDRVLASDLPIPDGVALMLDNDRPVLKLSGRQK